MEDRSIGQYSAALEHLRHEDRLFIDRARNFLMGEAFLVAGYAASGPDTFLRGAILSLGLILSILFLRTGVRSAQGIKFWRVFTIAISRDEYSPTDGPDVAVLMAWRESNYARIRREPFWIVFKDTNLVQGLWLPALVFVFWTVLAERGVIWHLEAESSSRSCDGTLLSGSIAVITAIAIGYWLLKLYQKLSVFIDPSSVKPSAATADAVVGDAGTPE